MLTAMRTGRNLYTHLQALMRPPLREGATEEIVREDEERKERAAAKDLETIGILFAYAVQQAPYSPGKLHQETDMAVSQRRFQEDIRTFFGERAREYAVGKITKEQLQEQYRLSTLEGSFRQRSVESMVMYFADDDRYEQLGRAVLEGAQEHHLRMQRRETDNYLGEHEALRRALSKWL